MKKLFYIALVVIILFVIARLVQKDTTVEMDVPETVAQEDSIVEAIGNTEILSDSEIVEETTAEIVEEVTPETQGDLETIVKE